MKKSASYDFYLIVATAAVLSIISLICIYGMFYFKFAQVNEMQAAAKMAYMNKMNQVVSPFLICLIVLLGICVPKRLLPTIWLNRFAVLLLFVVGVSAYVFGVIMALKINLCIALALQFVVLCLALSGNENLNFEKKGYWVRVGSSAMHLGIILFVLDLFFYKYLTLHLVIFWMTTFFTVVGMLGCFYSESVVQFIKKYVTIQRKS
jgi:hypothetical protein